MKKYKFNPIRVFFQQLTYALFHLIVFLMIVALFFKRVEIRDFYFILLCILPAVLICTFYHYADKEIKLENCERVKTAVRAHINRENARLICGLEFGGVYKLGFLNYFATLYFKIEVQNETFRIIGPRASIAKLEKHMNNSIKIIV